MGVEKKENLQSKAVKFILKKIRLLFLQHKFYFGPHADNLNEAQKFIIAGGYLTMGFRSDSMKLPILKPDSKDFDFVSEMIDEQIRARRRKFRKEQKSILFYVDDNMITRALGFKETKIHIQFVGPEKYMSPMKAAAYKAEMSAAESAQNLNNVIKKKR